MQLSKLFEKPLHFSVEILVALGFGRRDGALCVQRNNSQELKFVKLRSPHNNSLPFNSRTKCGAASKRVNQAQRSKTSNGMFDFATKVLCTTQQFHEAHALLQSQEVLPFFVKTHPKTSVLHEFWNCNLFRLLFTWR